MSDDQYLGFDRLAYPGDDAMADIFNTTSLFWCGFYLAPAPSQGRTYWMKSLPALRQIGWGIAPLYLGQQASGGPGSHTITPAQGTADGANAATLAQRAGFDDGSVIYLDVEAGGPIPQGYVDYVTAWSTEVNDNTAYRPAVYCSPAVARQLLALDPNLPTWVYNIRRFGKGRAVPTGPDGNLLVPDVADCGVAEATMWQYAHECTALPYTRADGTPGSLPALDMNVSTVRDPSQLSQFTFPNP